MSPVYHKLMAENTNLLKDDSCSLEGNFSWGRFYWNFQVESSGSISSLVADDVEVTGNSTR